MTRNMRVLSALTGVAFLAILLALLLVVFRATSEDKSLRLELKLDEADQKLLVSVTNVSSQRLRVYAGLGLHIQLVKGGGIGYLPMDPGPERASDWVWLDPGKRHTWDISYREGTVVLPASGGYQLSDGTYRIRAVLRRDSRGGVTASWAGYLESAAVKIEVKRGAAPPARLGPSPPVPSQDAFLKLGLALDEERQDLVVTLTNVGSEGLLVYSYDLGIRKEVVEGEPVSEVQVAPPKIPPPCEPETVAAKQSLTWHVGCREGLIAPTGFGPTWRLGKGRYLLRAVLRREKAAVRPGLEPRDWSGHLESAGLEVDTSSGTVKEVKPDAVLR